MTEPKFWKLGPGEYMITFLGQPMFYEHVISKEAAKLAGLPVWECSGATCPICQFKNTNLWPWFFRAALDRLKEAMDA